MRTLVCFWGIFCLSFIIAHAQWQPCSAPAINRINQIYTVKDAFVATSSQIGLPNVGPNTFKIDGEITHNTQLNMQYYNNQGVALRLSLNNGLNLR